MRVLLLISALFRYLPRRPPDRGKQQRWGTFLQNHRDAVTAMDFFVVPTARFRLLYVWFVIDHGRGRIIHFNVTTNPTAQWVIQQLREAFLGNWTPRYLIFDNHTRPRASMAGITLVNRRFTATQSQAPSQLFLARDRAGRVLPLDAALRITRLSASRYHGWRRGEAGCDLDDRSSCPRVVPTRLTPSEIKTVQEMVETDDYRHMSLRALALYAQRIGKIIASPSIWYRLVRVAGWRRPRNRVYPAKPKVGIRARAPGELLHLDVTIIKLLDGTRAYLHAVIDNYARRILSWTLEDQVGSGGAC